MAIGEGGEVTNKASGQKKSSHLSTFTRSSSLVVAIRAHLEPQRLFVLITTQGVQGNWPLTPSL